MIVFELDPKDCLMILKEKKSRIQGYQGFSKKEITKLENKSSK